MVEIADCIGNKTAWNSTISVLEVLVYLTHRQERNTRLGRGLPAYRLVCLKITSFLVQDSKQ